ncbi:PREDICTED: uncharacterized protein LOC109342918 [Lupinus angustifolius]|nr:PREDICTED: uncharacterized protein LOC109342918 [Lupinus angustifolius]
MAMLLPSKRFLLVALLFFCFISMTAKARSLRETSDIGVDKGQTSEMFKPNNNEGAHNSSDAVDTMDYTPAKKNPPIHN